YEKKEFLELSLDACKLYEGQIEGIENLSSTIKSYLDIQKELDKDIRNIKIFDFEAFQKDIEKYQDKCYYYKPMYKLYADFSIKIKKACENFESKNQTEKTNFSVDMEKYIYEKVVKELEKNGFKGRFPIYVYKDDKKIYILRFIIEKDKVSIESVDKKITSKKMLALLQNIDYREMLPIDLQDYFIIECEDKEGLEEWLEDVLEDVEIYKNRSELRQEIREILEEDDEDNLEDENKEGFMSKIFSIFKKKN
ncbi:MAG: hypothetical protein ACI4PU_05785, partial [Intestinibacter sp.]